MLSCQSTDLTFSYLFTLRRHINSRSFIRLPPLSTIYPFRNFRSMLIKTTSIAGHISFNSSERICAWTMIHTYHAKRILFALSMKAVESDAMNGSSPNIRRPSADLISSTVARPVNFDSPSPPGKSLIPLTVRFGLVVYG